MPAELSSRAASAIATRAFIDDASHDAFAKWQAAFSRHASAFPGFISIEFLPAYAGADEWHIIQRFADHDALERWRMDSERDRLAAQLASFGGRDGQALQEEAAPDFHAAGAVTEVITTLVEAGRKTEFLAWTEAIQTEQARFPGYMGTLVQAPLSAEVPYWTALVRYASPADLDRWINSVERRTLLERADPAIAKWSSRRLSAGFGEWFAPAKDGARPAAWKQTLLVLMVLFPVVMLEMRFLSPILSGLPLGVATFIGNAISVALVSWPLVGMAQSVLGWWLNPPPEHRARTDIIGGLVVAAIFVAEISLLSLLFP